MNSNVLLNQFRRFAPVQAQLPQTLRQIREHKQLITVPRSLLRRSQRKANKLGNVGRGLSNTPELSPMD